MYILGNQKLDAGDELQFQRDENMDESWLLRPISWDIQSTLKKAYEKSRRF